MNSTFPTFREAMIQNPGAALSNLEKRLKIVDPPAIYGDWNIKKEYKKVPEAIRTAFETLIEGYLLLQRTGETPKDIPPGITILGEPGVGKTKTVYALAQVLLGTYWYARQQFSPQFEPLIIEHIDWVQAVRSMIRNRSEEDVLISRAQKHSGVLFLDDIGAAAMPDFVAEFFYKLVDFRLKNWLPTIFISNATTDDLVAALDARVSHRLMRWTKVLPYE